MDQRRISIVLTGSILIAFLVSILGAHLIGTSSRTHGDLHPLAEALEDVQIVDTTSELLEEWMASSAKGRQLVHASRFLHFVAADEEDELAVLDEFPIRTFALPEFWVTKVNARNFLWIAMRKGIAREVHHVLPPEELDRRLEGLSTGETGVWLDGRRILTHDNGSRRLIGDRFPDLEEGVLFALDASYLQIQTVNDVFEELKASRLRSDLVVFCRSSDNPDVGAPERRRLDELVDLLRTSKR